MARKHKTDEHENHERWLVSYADFITLLFAFFVVMFASSHADAKKAAVVSESIRQAYQGETRSPGVISRVFGRTKDPTPKQNPGDFAQTPNPSQLGTHPPTIEGTYGSLKVDLAKEIDDGKVQLNIDRRGLVIRLQAGAFFPSGADNIAPEMYDTIQKIATAIGRLKNPVRLEGHTDSLPLHGAGRFPSNWHLSAARSVAVLDLFTGRFGLAPGRLAVVGYAETKPVDTNDTPEGRSHNRRVDVVLLNDAANENEPEASGTKKLPPPPPTPQPAPFWKQWLRL